MQPAGVCGAVESVTLLDMTAAVLESTMIFSACDFVMGDAECADPVGACTGAEAVPPVDGGDQRLAYSDTADEWCILLAENIGSAGDRAHALPAQVFLMVQAVLLIEAVLAIVSQQGHPWSPVGVGIAALLVLTLSANFAAGVAAARAEMRSSTEDNEAQWIYVWPGGSDER